MDLHLVLLHLERLLPELAGVAAALHRVGDLGELVEHDLLLGELLARPLQHALGLLEVLLLGDAQVGLVDHALQLGVEALEVARRLRQDRQVLGGRLAVELVAGAARQLAVGVVLGDRRVEEARVAGPRAVAVDAGVELAELKVEVVEIGAQQQRGLEVLDRLLILAARELLLVKQAEGHVRLVVEAVHADADLELLRRLRDPPAARVDDAEQVVGLREPRRVRDRGLQLALGGRQIADPQRRAGARERGLGGLARLAALLLLQLVELDLELELVDALLGLLGRGGPGVAAQQILVDPDRGLVVVGLAVQRRLQAERLGGRRAAGGVAVLAVQVELLQRGPSQRQALALTLGGLGLAALQGGDRVTNVGRTVRRLGVVVGDLEREAQPLGVHARVALAHPGDEGAALLEPQAARVVGPKQAQIFDRALGALALAGALVAKIGATLERRGVAGLELERRGVLADRVVDAVLSLGPLRAADVQVELLQALLRGQGRRIPELVAALGGLGVELRRRRQTIGGRRDLHRRALDRDRRRLDRGAGALARRRRGRGRARQRRQQHGHGAGPQSHPSPHQRDRPHP